ncbi:MAG: TspO/MBR family protein [Oscillochloridaceae bacterium]|nr:tryptophan-rich sensory protein [Chloroflexaceae bacterium]MDW8389616.1 TspO/MBR family protein [Oscillochloridaceae bacterium]
MTNALTHPTAADVTRQAAVVAALTGTIGANALTNIVRLNGQTIGDVATRFPLPIIPARYTFGIWGVIYSGLIGYAVYQALPQQRDNERLRRIAWPFVASCAANVTWLVLWHYNRFQLNFGAIVGLLLALITIDLRLGQARGPWMERLLVRLPFSIYLGWITVATIINAAVTLYDAGWEGTPASREVWTAGLLSMGAALGATLGIVRRDPAVPAVAAWAFSGIATKQAGASPVAPVAWGAAAASLTGAVIALLRASRRR